mmetsp:Transcript_22412/g.57084  ORF Transcript_22412/g.57084 Transcript_22412/m.57084 type:complete len:266 (+) Transcript_22412:495-1292(+)
MCRDSADPISRSGSMIEATWSTLQCSIMRCTTRHAYSCCAAFTMDLVPLATSSSMMNWSAQGRSVTKHFWSTWFAEGHRIADHTCPRSSCTNFTRSSSLAASSRACWTLRQPVGLRESLHTLPDTGASCRLFSDASDAIGLISGHSVLTSGFFDVIPVMRAHTEGMPSSDVNDVILVIGGHIEGVPTSDISDVILVIDGRSLLISGVLVIGVQSEPLAPVRESGTLTGAGKAMGVQSEFLELVRGSGALTGVGMATRTKFCPGPT